VRATGIARVSPLWTPVEKCSARRPTSAAVGLDLESTPSGHTLQGSIRQADIEQRPRSDPPDRPEGGAHPGEVGGVLEAVESQTGRPAVAQQLRIRHGLRQIRT
jgi:hypothetical protein